MDVEFVRTGDRSYLVRAHRADGTILETCGSGPGLPHDHDENLVNALERLYREACARRWQPPAPLPRFDAIPRILRSSGIDMATITSVRTALFEAHEEWRVVKTGATLQRRWPTRR